MTNLEKMARKLKEPVAHSDWLRNFGVESCDISSPIREQINLLRIINAMTNEIIAYFARQRKQKRKTKSGTGA